MLWKAYFEERGTELYRDTKRRLALDRVLGGQGVAELPGRIEKGVRLLRATPTRKEGVGT